MSNAELPAHPRPLPVELITCDWIITEAGTNKKTLIGIFEHISGKQFPIILPVMHLYVKITDAEGQYVFKLELEDLKENKIIGRAISDGIHISHRLVAAELIFRLQNLKFDHPGRYEFRLYGNDQSVGHKSVNVLELQPKEEGGSK